MSAARIPKHLKRNPNAPHIKAWHDYRARKGRPKAKLPSGRGTPLTYEKYKALMKDYQLRAKEDLRPKKEKADRYAGQIRGLLLSGVRPETMKQLDRVSHQLNLVQGATVSYPLLGYTIAKEVVGDFGRTKRLRVFGFGVGYAQLLFFFRNFMRAKTKGVDLGYYSAELTKQKRLGVTHGKNAAQLLRRQGKFDATYSINVFEDDIIDRSTALGMLDNLSQMTRKGGKSYHIISSSVSEVPVSRGEIRARGFEIEKWEKLGGSWTLIKLVKTRN